MIQKIIERLTSNWSLVLLSFFALFAVSLSFFAGNERQGGSERNLNISWFIFRDVNRNGVYDTSDRPYSGLRIELERPDGSTVSSASNINGFANFEMALRPELGVITQEGKYRMVAKPPHGWEVTSSSDTVEVAFAYLGRAPAGIVARSVPDPLGVAPVPEIRGRVSSSTDDVSISAKGPSGEYVEVETGSHGHFLIHGEPGPWTVTRVNPGNEKKTARNIALQYYPVVLSKSFFETSESHIEKRRVVAEYDDLTDSGTVYKIPNGYKGLNWKDWISAHNLFYNGSGYVNATISSEYVAYNSSGHPGTISSNLPFDFVKTYIGVAWPSAEKGSVHVEGYRGGELVYNDILRLSHRAPVYFHANYLDITELRIYSDIYWQVILENSEFRLSH